jgi:hypothetical protein
MFASKRERLCQFEQLHLVLHRKQRPTTGVIADEPHVGSLDDGDASGVVNVSNLDVAAFLFEEEEVRTANEGAGGFCLPADVGLKGGKRGEGREEETARVSFHWVLP